ncbi:hypothetical protein H6P81_003560 [Aristolochia fimbriata]|uniref:DUF4378 domain-containing protein n=1 Tax=Aristolochia fimbriata TaxID=158543 RepID=A0AAV7FCX2_ARIFI|nr:hypothetical protein H6P81_003560 [Aristolochia fimbriata]
MARKHLHELLSEEQEPFVLMDYINERRSLLQKPNLRLRKRKPVASAPTFADNFRKSSCFFASKSPLFEFPERSPCRQNMPSKTATLLLEAAMKIQRQSQDPKPNQKIGFFGSILKRMAKRKRSRVREICAEEIRVSVKDVLRWESFKNGAEMDSRYSEKGSSDMGFSCSCNTSDWTESNEEKSMDLESSSCGSEEFEALDLVANERREDDFRFDQAKFCESPFHFRVFPRSPDSSCRTPEFSSPARSSCCRKTEVMKIMSNDGCSSLADKDEEEDEKEKEQFSPVSVLDAPFEDDYDEHDDDEEEEEEVEDFHQNFETVQRARRTLMNKIRRFERLAELDPFELEKILDEEEAFEAEHEAQEKEAQSLTLDREYTDELVASILSMSGACHHCQAVPRDVKMLILDLIEEEQEKTTEETEKLARKVCKKLESWKDVELNTVDMMVELDFRLESNKWKRDPVEVQVVGSEIEYAILGLLVEELSVDLVELHSP